LSVMVVVSYNFITNLAKLEITERTLTLTLHIDVHPKHLY